MDRGTLTVDYRKEADGVVLVVLSGEADYAASRLLRSRLERAQGQRVVVDMEHVTLCDASCIAALAFAAKERSRRGETLTVRDPPTMLLRTLQRLCLTDVFTFE